MIDWPGVFEQEAALPGAAMALVVLSAWAGAICARRWKGATSPWRRRAWLLAGNVAFVLAVASSLAVAGEVYFRWIYDQSDGFSRTRTSQRWFSRHYRFNDRGVRDSIDYDAVPAPGKRRITFIGDSFANGHGVDVERRFVNRVRAARKDWEVHLLGRNGEDTSDQLYLIRSGTPDYVLGDVVLVYCLNDIASAMGDRDAPYLPLRTALESPSALVRGSFLLDTLYYRWVRVRDGGMQEHFARLVRAYEDAATWDRQRKTLRWLREAVEARGGRFLVVTFPMVHALEGEQPFAEAHRRLGALWSELGVPHLDLLDVMAKHAGEGLTVNPWDAHPNERAHELAAIAIGEFLDAHRRPGEAGAR